MMTPYAMPGKKAEVRWEWIGDAWKLFANNPGAWIGMILVSAIATAAVATLSVVLMVFLFIPAGATVSSGDFGAILATLGFALLLIPVFLLACMAMTAYFTSGMYRAAINQAQGKMIAVADLFSAGDCFMRILGLLILVVIGEIILAVVFSIPGLFIEGLESLGSMASYIPNIIIQGFIFFTAPLIVDRNMGVFEAIGASIEATKSQWWMFAIFVFVLGLLSIVGAFACLVGILVTAPLYFTASAAAYRDTFGLPGARSYEAFPIPPPPPDYRN